MFEFLKTIKKAKKLNFEINLFWVAKIVIIDIKSSASSKTNQIKIESKSCLSQSFILKSLLSLSKNVVFTFIAFEFSKNLKTDFRLQIFCVMRWFVSVAEIFNSFSDDMKKLRESDRQQLFHRFKRNASLDKSLFSLKQLIIENSFEN